MSGWGPHRQGRHPAMWSQEQDVGFPGEAPADPAVFYDSPRARIFHRLLGLTFLTAFLSLGVQIRTLIGPFGLLPVSDLMSNLHHRGVPWWEVPTYFWIASDTGMIDYGIALGVILSLLSTLGVAPRFMLIFLIPLYLSFTVACTTFLSFQWDALLLETGVLALFLRREKPTRWVHFLFLALLFKLYFESGIAKWESHLGDWQDGSAMTFYYETAPLPTWLGYYAHHLPTWWHQLESRLVLVLELVVPFLIFGPRRARLVAFFALAGFQILNILTANYGFFSYLSLFLHAFLLDEADWHRLRLLARRIYRRPAFVAVEPAEGVGSLDGLVGVGVVGAWLFLSAVGGWQQFSGAPLDLGPKVGKAVEVASTFRLVNTYHLFSQITRERNEPEIQSWDGREWRAHPFKYKPGPVDRRPPFVAPHQPRVDFRLWFYGLSYERGTPTFVTTLLERACQVPRSLDGLLAEPLPAEPVAVRVVLWRYHFTSEEERAETGAWWRRDPLEGGAQKSCGRRPKVTR